MCVCERVGLTLIFDLDLALSSNQSLLASFFFHLFYYFCFADLVVKKQFWGVGVFCRMEGYGDQ